MIRNLNRQATRLFRYFVLIYLGKDPSRVLDLHCSALNLQNFKNSNNPLMSDILRFILWCVHPRSTNITDSLSSLNYFPLENYRHNVASAITLQVILHSSPYNVIRRSPNSSVLTSGSQSLRMIVPNLSLLIQLSP